MATTYEEFEKAAQNAGLLSQFSQYDLDLAQKYPDFGQSILTLKQNYANAATDEQKQQINAQANDLRSQYGNYTGGTDGSQYISTGKLPNEISSALEQVGSYAPFSYDAAKPEYSSQNDSAISNVLSQIGSYAPFSFDTPAPTYTNQYAAQQQALLDAILNREDFSWSKEQDPNWSAYKKEYLREGDRAAANALALASAASGGIPSSYAVNAASQAGDYYATQLADMIPTLVQQAYEKYLNEYNMKLQDLGAVNTQEQLDYAKFLDQLAQYNTDRNFAYTDYQTQYNMLQSYLAALQSQKQQDLAEYQTELAQYNTDRNFAYTDYQTQYNMLQTYLANLQGQQQTELNQQQQNLANALSLAQVFGYVPESGAAALGIAAGTPTAAQQQYQDSLQQYQDALKQQEFSNALNLYQSSGYVPEGAAGTLGLAAGTPTAAQKQYADSMAFQQQQYADSQAASQQSALADFGAAFLQQGVMPSAEMLAAMGITAADAQAYIAAIQAQQAAASYSGSSGGSSSGSGSSGSSMTLTTAKQAASAGAFNDEVLAVLRANGYTDDMLEAIYGYTTGSSASVSGSSSGGYNEALFTAAMRSVAAGLAQGNEATVFPALDSLWGKLSQAQKQTAQELLAKYGYQYTEG